MNIFDYDIPKLEQINTPTGRFYKTPAGDLYPSVTTVLDTMPKPELEAWLEKVGKEEAHKISTLAANRGTLIHEAAEDHLLNRPIKIHPFRQTERRMFNELSVHLDRFEEVHALEKKVYSETLRVAGTVDCVAKVDGEVRLIDFKTSGRYKTSEDIHSYYMQCAAYAVCWFERTGMALRNLRILMSTEDNGVLVFDQPIKPWVAPFIELRKNLP